MAHIKADADLHRCGESSDFATASLDAYLDRICAGPAARSHVMAWWMISGNGDPGRISAAEFLSSCAYSGGQPEGMLAALAQYRRGNTAREQRQRNGRGEPIVAVHDGDHQQFAQRLQIEAPPLHRVDFGLADNDALPSRIQRRL